MLYSKYFLIKNPFNRKMMNQSNLLIKTFHMPHGLQNVRMMRRVALAKNLSSWASLALPTACFR